MKGFISFVDGSVAFQNFLYSLKLKMLEKVINSKSYYQIVNRYTYYCNTCNINYSSDITRRSNIKSSTDNTAAAAATTTTIASDNNNNGNKIKTASIYPEPMLMKQKSTFRMEEEEKQLIEAKSRLYKVPSECCCNKLIRFYNNEPSPYHFDYYLAKPTSHNIDNLLFQLKQAYGYAKRTSTSFRTRKSDTTATTSESSSRSSLNMKIHANSLTLLIESHNIKVKSGRRTMSVKNTTPNIKVNVKSYEE